MRDKVLKSARNTSAFKIATNIEGKLCSGGKILPPHKQRVKDTVYFCPDTPNYSMYQL